MTARRATWNRGKAVGPIYEQTRNIEAVRQLLGHASVGSTSAYLNIDKRKALDIGRRWEL